MNNLKVGFARIDNTPPLGAPIDGYTFQRYSEGVLDPLEINTLAFADGERRAILVSVDLMLVSTKHAAELREAIEERTGVPKDAIYITATHSHTAPSSPKASDDEIAKEYYIAMRRRVADSAVLAIEDLAPAKMGFGMGKAENVSFCRRFRMKDGSCQTNPGVNNPEIDHPMSEVDTRVGVLRFDRDDKESIVIANFPNHPDVVGGNYISADWPGAARRTVERVYDNVKCVLLNGAQGDINHVNVHPTGGYGNDLFNDFDDVARGYGHAMYVGRVVAAGVMQAYDKVEYVDVDTIGSLVKTIPIPSNKADPEQLPEAQRIWQMHLDGRDAELPYRGMMLTTVVAEARRMVQLKTAPDNFTMDLIGLRLGEVAFIGIPGEPFELVGTSLKKNENYKLVIPTCITNGYQGYFPSRDAYAEGGYEARSSLFRAGVAEIIVDGGNQLLNELAKQAATGKGIRK